MKVIKYFDTQVIENAIVFETKIHRYFAKERRHGEYFDIKFEDAVEKINNEIQVHLRNKHI